MLVRIKKFAGIRETLLNKDGNSVKLFSWHHPVYAPGHHLALEITKGTEAHYLSISPALQPNFHGCSMFKLRNGYEAYFINSHADECLIQGFRNAHPDGSLKKFSDKEVFDMARKLPDAKKTELIIKGQPQHTIQLYSLDLNPMIEKIKYLKLPESVCLLIQTGMAAIY